MQLPQHSIAHGEAAYQPRGRPAELSTRPRSRFRLLSGYGLRPHRKSACRRSRIVLAPATRVIPNLPLCTRRASIAILAQTHRTIQLAFDKTELTYYSGLMTTLRNHTHEEPGTCAKYANYRPRHSARPAVDRHSAPNRSAIQETISNSRSAKFDRMRQSSANYNENSCPPAREAPAIPKRCRQHLANARPREATATRRVGTANLTIARPRVRQWRSVLPSFPRPPTSFPPSETFE